MKTTKIYIAATALALAGTNSAVAYPLNGDLNSWLQGSGSWDPKGHVNKHVKSDGVLAPGGGGQPYDAEAMYLDWDADRLYVAVVTGTPKTGTDYGPGDLAINFGTPVNNHYAYGLETTGRIGGRARMEDGDHGNTKITKDNGDFRSGKDGKGNYIYASHWSGDHGYTKDSNEGSLYSVAAGDWGVGLPGYGISNPTSILKGTEEASVSSDGIDYFYDVTNYFGDGDTHYLIEAGIPMTAFDSDDWDAFMAGDVAIAVHWTQNCGNDSINLTDTHDPTGGGGNPGGSIPEPGTIALMGLGFAGFGFCRRRKRQI